MSARAYALALSSVGPARRVGFVTDVHSGYVEAHGPLSTVGDICEIARADGQSGALAEVAAVREDRIVLIPFDQTAPISPDARIIARPSRSLAPVGAGFAGRAVDALGEAIDGGPPVLASERAPLAGQVLAPMERQQTSEILETGVRAIDGLLSLGRGQRVGVFAAGGVGKTTLMTQLVGQIAADRCVLCLVGERGREVEALWRNLSRRADAARFAYVAATSDVSAPLRARAVLQALALAEHWRGLGEHVLLVVDSVTRYAMALREIGLAAGAPPTLRAYTPNVLTSLPRLVERCGAARSGGAITAVMTVLSETDDVDDPIVEVMKALLDGHLILSRELAEQGHYPAIDVLRSVSRQAEHVMNARHAADARRATSLLAVYEDSRVLIESGVYKAGSNARLDTAVAQNAALTSFLRQASSERCPLSDTLAHLRGAIGQEPARA